MRAPSPKLAAVALIACTLGLPVNDLPGYTLLAFATLVFYLGTVTASPRRFMTAIAVAALTIVVKLVVAPPLIEEGHNVFVVDSGQSTSALERGLPPAVFRFMLAEFDRVYPLASRCNRNVSGCWRGEPMPDRAYAFSGDGIYGRPEFSRHVAGIDIDDPKAWRTGFINERKYNWYDHRREGFIKERKYNWYDHISDVTRSDKPRPGLLRRVEQDATFPWFAMFRFPAVYARSALCWQGKVLWEGADGQFMPVTHVAPDCRTLEAVDIGKRIYGVSIDPKARLSMQLRQTGLLQARHWIVDFARLGGALAILLLLAPRPVARDFLLPGALVAGALVVVAIHDPIFFGRMHIHEGGNDGVTHEGMGRTIVQALLRGDFIAALRSDEAIFYFVPGFRYLRALEKFIFGDTDFAYLSALLASPLLFFTVYRRFVGPGWALLAAICFITSLGFIFGLSLRSFVRVAASGFPDTAGTFAFLAGLILIASQTLTRWSHGLGGALLLGLAVWLRPNLFPPAAVIVIGAALMSLQARDLPRAIALCAGFSVVGLMTLHNWVFGHKLVLFGSNATIPEVLVVPPQVYLAALSDIAHLNLRSEALSRIARQLFDVLLGPMNTHAFAPVCAAEIAIVIRVALRRQSAQWERLLAVATLAGLSIMLFYVNTPRYHSLTWLLTAIVSAVWLRDEGFPWLRANRPDLVKRWDAHPLIVAATKRWHWIERNALAR